jgi:hypothetical protein
MYLLPPAPEPEGAAEVPDVFTWPGPSFFAKTWLPFAANAAEIARSITTFDIAFMAVSPICGPLFFLSFLNLPGRLRRVRVRDRRRWILQSAGINFTGWLGWIGIWSSDEGLRVIARTPILFALQTTLIPLNHPRRYCECHKISCICRAQLDIPCHISISPMPR